MRILINTTNLKVGGGLQVAYSVINEFKHFPEHEYHVLMSPQLQNVLNTDDFSDNFRFYQFEANPTNSTKDLFVHRKNLYKIEKKVRPDFVLTVFGPALWKPRKRHMVGFANGYFLFYKTRFIQKFILTSLLKKITYYLRRKIMFQQLKAEGDIFWVETKLAQRELCKVLSIGEEKVQVIPNTYGSQYENVKPEKKYNDIFSFLYLASNYEQKNLPFFNLLIPVLLKRNIQCRFYLTLTDESYKRLFTDENIRERLINLGPVDPEKAPEIYNKADALFFPSLLETFSANYPEAMKMERPILTSDLPFAHDVCADAALYFNPYDAEDAADKIEQIINERQLREMLIANGNKRLTIFGNAADRAKRILDFMTQYT